MFVPVCSPELPPTLMTAQGFQFLFTGEEGETRDGRVTLYEFATSAPMRPEGTLLHFSIPFPSSAPPFQELLP